MKFVVLCIFLPILQFTSVIFIHFYSVLFLLLNTLVSYIYFNNIKMEVEALFTTIQIICSVLSKNGGRGGGQQRECFITITQSAR